MVKVEDQAEPQAPPQPSNAENPSTKPNLRFFMYFIVAVLIALSLQKAIPAFDVALSCHAKVVCSGVFVSNRSYESIDISRVRLILYLILVLLLPFFLFGSHESP